ncbi:MAG: hypothetical protein K0R00_79 [Herbinix sp.]|jgi:hypothetical protein|nr:hypothetical protein [Herbinix sp.]
MSAYDNNVNSTQSATTGIGTTYTSAEQSVSSALLPTKHGFEQFVILPTKLNTGWVGISNTAIENNNLQQAPSSAAERVSRLFSI